MDLESDSLKPGSNPSKGGEFHFFPHPIPLRNLAFEKQHARSHLPMFPPIFYSRGFNIWKKTHLKPSATKQILQPSLCERVFTGSTPWLLIGKNPTLHATCDQGGKMTTLRNLVYNVSAWTCKPKNWINMSPKSNSRLMVQLVSAEWEKCSPLILLWIFLKSVPTWFWCPISISSNGLQEKTPTQNVFPIIRNGSCKHCE